MIFKYIDLLLSIINMQTLLRSLTLLLSCSSLIGQHSHSLDKSPLRFIENKGQWNHTIQFQSKLPAAEVFIREDRITYHLKDEQKYGEYVAGLHDGNIKPSTPITLDETYIDLYLENAISFDFNGAYAYQEQRNYFLGNDSTKWGRHVKSYAEVNGKNVYQGVDMRIFHTENSIKYEFVIAPGADHHQIELRYDGADRVWINKNGELEITNSINNFRENRPLAYQIIDGKYKEVHCEFTLTESGTVAYTLRRYNKKYPLTIDPQLIFSTASGSTADNWGNTACLDSEGNLYSGGTVFEFRRSGDNTGTPNGFPTTAGAFQTTYQGGGTDMGILKFDSSGQNLIYATYIGGDDSEIPTSMITNQNGDLFILGVTGSNNFPAAANAFSGGTPYTPVGGYQFRNGSDIIVIKLDKDGSDITKSRFVGGPGNDGNNMEVKNTAGNVTSTAGRLAVINYGDQLRGEIILDEQENIYVASSTNNNLIDTATNFNQSPDFPTKNAFQPNFGGGFQDGVVFKIHHSLDSLEWSSYLGGLGPDACYGLKLSSDSSLYVTGITGFPIFERDSLSYQPDFFGAYDGFLTKIKSDGTEILNYTYLGTPERDAGFFVEVDSEGSPYVLGQTFGDYGHSSDSIFFVDREGVFIHKLSPDLDSSVFFTTIGDTFPNNPIAPNISPTAFLVNECGNIFISGWGGITNSYYAGSRTNGLPLSTNTFQSTSDGSDFYMAVFLKDMDTLLYATYFGVAGVAEHVDGGTSRFSNSGIVYQSVCAGCGGRRFINFPENSTGEYPKQNASGNCSNGVFKYDLASLIADIDTDTTCTTLETIFKNNTVGGIQYEWFFGDGTDTLVTNKNDITHIYQAGGDYTVTLVTTDITTCKLKDTANFPVRISDRLSEQKFSDTLCQGETLDWTAYLADQAFDFQWLPQNGLNDPNIPNPVITADTTLLYRISLTDSSGCVREDSLSIFVPFFEPNLGLTVLPNCTHESKPKIRLSTDYSSNFAPEIINWQINNSIIQTQENELLYAPQNFGKQHVQVNTSFENCAFEDTSSVVLEITNVPNIITPNADGKNDVFIITGIRPESQWNLEIYNRWGKLIFETEDYQNDWGAQAEENTNTYFYELTAPDGSKCKGWLQVVR